METEVIVCPLAAVHHHLPFRFSRLSNGIQPVEVGFDLVQRNPQ